MRHLKHTAISLLILTALSFSASANQPKTAPSHKADTAHEQTKAAQPQTAELERLKQRALFLQLESLLKSAVKNNSVFDNAELFLKLIDLLKGYPLQTDATAAYLDARLKTVNGNDPVAADALDKDLLAFIKAHPHHFTRSKLEQARFGLLTQQKNWQALSDYGKAMQPKNPDAQIAVLNADYQLASAKLKNPRNAEAWATTDVMQRFEKLWLTNAELPGTDAILTEWVNIGGRSSAKIYQKAERLFGQNDAKGLERLINEIGKNDSTAAELQLLQNLLKKPAALADLAAKAPTSDNAVKKFAVVQTFPRYLKTLPEQMTNPDFTPYLQWAKNWQLNEAQIREWKIAFLGRFFDNESPLFQQWRDVEIAKLKTDNLTERRLRMALWQKTDLTPWLNGLSAEGREKQEWRYWLAKTDAKKTHEILTALSHERGFYPMLAAAKLDPKTRGSRYNFGQPQLLTAASISDEKWHEEFKKLKPSLDEIAELRRLDRLGPAKQRWRFLLENLSGENKKEKQIALSQYANEQHWFDLGVDGSIMAKAFNYIQLRLPSAYNGYFEAALNRQKITKTFAMAIARQESAWNPQAQSSANARGLMQLLPSTAKATAANAKLPYAGEADLFKPLNNILLGTAHLAELNEKYPNNRILMASAYNAGAHRVEKWLARANGKLSMDEFVASIPFYETRGYVQNVLTYDFYYQVLQKKENPQTFSNEEYDRLY